MDWLNKRTLTWAGFDVASSVYFGIGPALLLPLYFQKLMAGFSNPTAAWGGLAASPSWRVRRRPWRRRPSPPACRG